ncbi:exodeoxyribonuclease III [Herbidospora sp. RD11066]
MSVLTVNIGATSLDRAGRLLEWLATRPEQVILLTETSSGDGTAHLLARFASAGWRVAKTPDVERDRGAALVSRIPIIESVDLAPVSIPGRVAAAVLDTRPRITVAAVYVPSRDRSEAKVVRKETFIASLVKALGELPAEVRQRLVLGGDYNVIPRHHQPAHKGFFPWEFGLLDSLAELGLVDAHDHLHPDAQPHSWIGRTNDGYRYDYLHCGAELSERLTGCSYLHETRAQGLTDHAAVTMDLRIDAEAVVTTELNEPAEATLF